MKTEVESYILAAVTTVECQHLVAGSTAIFIAENQEDLQRLCLLLSRILKGMSHDLENGVFIIVKH